MKSLDLKLKWCSRNDYSYKWSFYCYITWQFLLSGEGTNLWWRKKLFQVLVEWANFWLVARFLSIPHKENSTLLIYIYICNIYIKYIYYIYTYMYIYIIYYTYIYIYLHICIYVFIYLVSFCAISVSAQIGIDTIRIISKFTQILRPTFLRQGF